MRVRVIRALHLTLVLMLFSTLHAAAAFARPGETSFISGKAGFSVAVRGEINPYSTLGVYVLPEELLTVEVSWAPAGSSFDLRASTGQVVGVAPRRFSWRAPREPGLHPLDVVRRGAAGVEETMRLNVFVMVPMSTVENGRLNGYRIGDYPAKPLKNLPIYLPPRGFIEVRPENESTFISPHFTLRQFLCKQSGDYPKYVVLRERLLLKLEHLLALVNRRGIQTETFFVMSGYRTPSYNRAIGNVEYSRHQWGGAADIFIDVDPRDGVMDDLDGNGRVDEGDAAFLYQLIDAQEPKEDYRPFIGGLGQYGSTAAHGPFVHVDVRGFRARWGR